MYQPIYQFTGQIVSTGDASVQTAAQNLNRTMLLTYGGIAFGIVLGAVLFRSHRILGGLFGAFAGGVTGALVGATTQQPIPNAMTTPSGSPILTSSSHSSVDI